MSRRNSHRQPASFIDTLGVWTVGPELTRRSHRRSRRSTVAADTSRASNVPPHYRLSAAEARRLAETGYDSEDECDCCCSSGGADEEQRHLPAPRNHAPNPFNSAWSHSSASRVTQEPVPIPRRESYIGRLRGRPAQEAPRPQSRHRMSFDANNDALFANLPRPDGQRFPGEIVVHRQSAGEGMTETFGQPRMYAHPVRESQFFDNPRAAPPAPRDEWPGPQMHAEPLGARMLIQPPASQVPRRPGEFRNRIDSWRDSIPSNEFGPPRSAFGGSNAPTIWPGPAGRAASELGPDDSLTCLDGQHGRSGRTRRKSRRV
ncbi:hypothetical protein F66182_5159 [Fusarium sp. NRRL 66182]|nr:hypothetical protein F66182_5159 [Fusarium sp. NRRL 66182]